MPESKAAAGGSGKNGYNQYTCKFLLAFLWRTPYTILWKAFGNLVIIAL